MQQRYFGLAAVALVLVACGVGSPDAVKTPDQILAEQEALGDEQLKKERTSNNNVDTSGSSEEEKKREWDDKQADLELHRAAHSAETCPESVVESDKDAKPAKGAKKPPPRMRDTKTTATLTFENDGHVKSLNLSPPYDEETNAVGKCVARALKAVIVPAYQGSEHTVVWMIDLTGGKKSGPVEKGDAKGE